MRFSMRSISLFLLGLVLVACETSQDENSVPGHLVGSGNLTMGARAQANFEKYRSARNSAYFSIDVNGGATGWTYCTGGPDACPGPLTKYEAAINNCEKRTHLPCRILARGWEIIWDGKIRYVGLMSPDQASENSKQHPRLKGLNPALSKVSIKEVCRKAGDFSVDPYQWSQASDVRDYVNEAIGRNLFIYQCAFELGYQ